MSWNIRAETCEQGFKMLNRAVLYSPDFVLDGSRLGACNELISASLLIEDPTTYIIEDERINRISYEYAEQFWQFLISGGTDAQEAFERYPNVAKFICKPKSDVLPENFNTFYGPRIAQQLPVLLKELTEKKNSRRVVFHILDVEDQKLLDLDESLEYPCTDSVTYNIRDGKLYSHVHMRSQNASVVLQLDMYLQCKLMKHVADAAGVELGTITFTMVSAHSFERDRDYVENFLS